MQDEILKRLDALAQKLGTTAEHLWAVLIRQSYIEGVEDVAVGVGCVFAFLFCLRQYLNPREGSDEDVTLCIRIVCILAMVALGIAGMSCLYGAPGELGNPEYRALQEVFKALGK